MKMLVALSACLFFGTVVSGTLDDEWNAWKTKFDKHYGSYEEAERFDIWRANHRTVVEHNRLFDAGRTTYKMGMNKFAAMTKDEFRSLLIPSDLPGHHAHASSYRSMPRAVGASDVQNSVDWRQDGVVTPVKNQGQLGSCYSFSAIEAVEGQYAKETGNLLSFSEQQVVDCNQGGDGGFPYKVYDYLVKCGGAETEAEYPYDDRVGRCQFSSSKVKATVESYKFVEPFGDEGALKYAVATVGPISVSEIKVFASFQLYESGIYYESKCNNPDLNGEGYHAMLATGYGKQDGKDYWMVKNSWGTDWGENGYIQWARNEGNNCGIASQPSYPVMTRSQPKN